MQLRNHMEEIQLSKIREIGELANKMAKEGRSVVKLQVGERRSTSLMRRSPP